MYLLIKDISGYFKIYSFFIFSNFRFFGFYLKMIEKAFAIMSEQKTNEINSNINKNKIFFLNVSQLIYGFEDTCSYIPTLFSNETFKCVIHFIPYLMKFLSDFNILHIYTYCNIDEFINESDEKIWEELEGLSRTYTYKNGGLLLSVTNILFFILSSSIECEEIAIQIIKFIDHLIFNRMKPQNFEKSLNLLNANSHHDKIRKWIDSIDYFSSKKSCLIEVYSQVNYS